VALFWVVPCCALPEVGLSTDATAPDVEQEGAADAIDETDASLDSSSEETAFDAGFLPLALPNLTLWLRADLGITASNNIVSVWTDQSPNNNDAKQTKSGRQPTLLAAALNGQPAVSFVNATVTYMQITDSPSLKTPNITVAAVVRYTAEIPYSPILSRTTSATFTDGWGLGSGPTSTPGQLEFWTNNYISPSSATVLALGSWHFVVGVYDGANVTLYVDNVAQTPAPYTNSITYPAQTDTLIAAFWGSNSNGPSGFASIDVAEALMYGRGLSTSELSQLHAYVATRYALP
jgi:hypothetical protein